jgi:hypothetical protein
MHIQRKAHTSAISRSLSLSLSLSHTRTHTHTHIQMVHTSAICTSHTCENSRPLAPWMVERVSTSLSRIFFSPSVSKRLAVKTKRKRHSHTQTQTQTQTRMYTQAQTQTRTPYSRHKLGELHRRLTQTRLPVSNKQAHVILQPLRHGQIFEKRVDELRFARVLFG